MAWAYVDTSCLVAIALEESGSAALRRRLVRFEELLASNLLEAELRAALRREDVSDEPELLGALSWVVPDRPLGAEIARVLSAGYVRGADCWHLATALYVSSEPGSLTFVTLDTRQRAVASKLGFAT
jgi:predicted nucleic acid-binding protein